MFWRLLLAGTEQAARRACRLAQRSKHSAGMCSPWHFDQRSGTGGQAHLGDTCTLLLAHRPTRTAHPVSGPCITGTGPHLLWQQPDMQPRIATFQLYPLDPCTCTSVRANPPTPCPRTHRPATRAALHEWLPLAAQIRRRPHARGARHVKHLVVISTAAAVPCISGTPSGALLEVCQINRPGSVVLAAVRQSHSPAVWLAAAKLVMSVRLQGTSQSELPWQAVWSRHLHSIAPAHANKGSVLWVASANCSWPQSEPFGPPAGPAASTGTRGWRVGLLRSPALALSKMGLPGGLWTKSSRRAEPAGLRSHWDISRLGLRRRLRSCTPPTQSGLPVAASGWHGGWGQACAEHACCARQAAREGLGLPTPCGRKNQHAKQAHAWATTLVHTRTWWSSALCGIQKALEPTQWCAFY